MNAILPKSLDDFWAVVVYESYGGGTRLLWSPEHHDWLPSNAYGSGFVRMPVPGYEGRPYDDELSGAIALADELLRRRICQRCGLSDLEDHFVAPDVFGTAALYCLQQPDPRVVSSFGGTGTRKHWGSRLGCASVRAKYFTDRDNERYVDYGEGLVASHVRDWEWCARCTGAAGNVACNPEVGDRSPWDYVEEVEGKTHIRRYPYAL
ncbi:hypothetical protein [Amycolatopsis albispora]|uniref:hypothetical protein n=1 Tax=Amycolatopsis albispora TaxID=1804986 RepID=UPI0013B3D271|nr:hypothetical protein [Amycolatopsis albispora]